MNMDAFNLKLARGGYTTPWCVVCDDAGCEHCPNADPREWPEYAAKLELVGYEDNPS
jgi:hypothetical protein